MKKKLAVTVLALLVSVTVQAANIASYGFNDVATSSDSETKTTASAFTNGAGVTAFFYSAIRQEGSKSAYFANASFNSTTEAAAVSASDYVLFNIGVNSGTSVSFTSLSFYTLRRPTTGAGAPDRFAIRTSRDNYAANVATGAIAVSALETDTAFNLNTLDLSGVQNLQSVTNSTEFRIYMWASQGIGVPASRVFYMDKLSVGGTVTTIAD